MMNRLDDNKKMSELEMCLDEAYNALEKVDKLYDEVTQKDRLKIDYIIEKRKLVCERITSIRKEIELDKRYAMLSGANVGIDEAKSKDVSTIMVMFLDNVRRTQKISKILYKKDTAQSPNGYGI